MAQIPVERLVEVTARALKRAGAAKVMAQSTAQALVAAEAAGLSGHGLSRVALYCQHLKEGRADGKAKPTIIKRKGATALIDAGGGLAFPACAQAAREAITRAKKSGVSFVGVTNSHHMGALAYHRRGQQLLFDTKSQHPLLALGVQIGPFRLRRQPAAAFHVKTAARLQRLQGEGLFQHLGLKGKLCRKAIDDQVFKPH